MSDVKFALSNVCDVVTTAFKIELVPIVIGIDIEHSTFDIY